MKHIITPAHLTPNEKALWRTSRHEEENGNIPYALEVHQCIESVRGEVFLRSGWLNFCMGDYAKALDHYKKALAIDEMRVWAAHGIVSCLNRLEEEFSTTTILAGVKPSSKSPRLTSFLM